MGTVVSVGTRLGVTLTVVGGGRGVCVEVDSTCGVAAGMVQAEVKRRRNPIRIFFFIRLIAIGDAKKTGHLV